MKHTNQDDDRFIGSKQINRRRFLQLLVVSGAVIGCRRVAPIGLDGTPTVLPVTMTLDLRYVLENAAVAYSPHPRGCEITSIRGSVRTADGSPVPGIAVRVWDDEATRALTLVTAADGYYSCDVASSTSDDAFHVQLLDSAGTTLYSDVVTAQAAASCSLNMMTVNFVATR